MNLRRIVFAGLKSALDDQTLLVQSMHAERSARPSQIT